MNLNIPTITFPQSLTAPRGSGHAIIDIDLDGVCADYTTAMRTICAKEFNISEESIPEPNTYNLVSATGLAHQGQKDIFADPHKGCCRPSLQEDPNLPGNKRSLQLSQ